MGILQSLIDAHKFKVMMENEVDPKVHITEFVQMRNDQNKPFFAYIRIKPSQYLEYRRKVDIGDEVDLKKYEILEYGWGVPTETQRQIMSEKHNVDTEYENKVRKKLMKKKQQESA